MRPDGIYWVRDRKNGDEWRLARWNPAQGWWVVAFPSIEEQREHAVIGEGRLSEIGPSVESPTSIEIKHVQMEREHDQRKSQIEANLRAGARLSRLL